MTITHNPKNCIFETTIEGITAHVKYSISDGSLDIRHTFVPKQISGRGIASDLVSATYKWAETQNLKPKATCSYASVWLKRHGYNVPETPDHINGNNCAI
ncbi:MAG: N-acetyltransferase [Prolixibacteraceae bacterium]|nr:N-acetyltransferase [Prolixibacteraceae bacterium]